ncbi:HPP family protein [Plebeiibacterium sediminum]|uniref:HPP family protein n=1 Tax=Plebeiibacterium sediminum TaxID=2992112 RepID=A0AAE3M9R2_9BACT|nr:HPP family protein [Plebeiobacterium sediminum]MCW3789577.1 HPP family protein [Plebeiobacterium sediminum]
MVVRKIKRSIRFSKYVIYRETLIDYKEFLWSFIGAFVGIGLIAFIQSTHLSELENIFLIGSFGASSVLIYGAVESPLAQPRNLIGGHFISAIIGVTIFKILPEIIWITAPLAVATSIVAMQLTKTLHPPGGATALIAVIGTEKVKAIGYFYAISPVLSGAFILFLVALVFNNMTKHRTYPTNGRVREVLRKIKLKISNYKQF